MAKKIKEPKSLFKPVYKETHNARLKIIGALSKNQYIDDGSMALYFAVKNMQSKGLHGNVEYCLLELEKFYADDIFKKKSSMWLKR